jgi:hypothetical protein
MEGDLPFEARLSQAVAARRTAIDRQEIPKLKELFRVFHSNMQGLHGILIRKSLVQQDPYKDEQKIVSLKNPPDDPYMESERDVVLGVRLDAYDTLLEYVDSYVEIRSDTIDFKQMKGLADVVRYIQWDHLTTSSPLPTTRGLAELTGRARSNTDSLANSVLTDSIAQLAKLGKEIVAQLKHIGVYKREEYKLTLREQVFPKIADASSLQADDTASIQIVKKAYKEAGIEGPFIPELASEIIAEDHGDEGQHLQSEALRRLEAAVSKKKSQKPKVSLRETLVASIRGLSAASRQFDVIVENLRHNNDALAHQKKSFGQRFRDWIEKITNQKMRELTYRAEFIDENTGAKQSEVIRFEEFVGSVNKKARLYGAFLSKSGNAWTKLQAAGDEQLLNYITKELSECHMLHRRAQALDTAMKSEAPPLVRQKMKGIKIELTGIKNAIAAANQLKHEYVAKKDEQEQMEKLGVAE